MKRISAIIMILVLTICFAGCESASDVDDGKLSIVATSFPHYDFARQITKGCDSVDIKMLISPGSEVHTYEPTPSDILAISSCDMFIYTGGESDVWAKGILSSAKQDGRVVSFMDICLPDGHTEHVGEDGHGHSHDEVYDEHVWTNPIMAKALAEHIYYGLCEIDKENETLYKENLDAFLSELSKVDEALTKVAEESVRDGIIVADRFPFYHLAVHYGIGYEAAYPGCSSDTEPSAAVIASLSQKVREENIPYVFTIEFSNGRIAKNVISGSDAKILTLHSCQNVSAEDFDGGVTYTELMMRNADSLRKALCE